MFPDGIGEAVDDVAGDHGSMAQRGGGDVARAPVEVDAQPGGLSAAAEVTKAHRSPIKGAHEQVRAVFQGTGGEGRLKISEGGQEREVPFRPPLEKLDRIKPGQEVVLLMDEQGYVLEIATPDVIPVR